MPSAALIASTPPPAPSRARWIAPLLIALLLGACTTTGDLMDDLNTSLRGYEKAIRWAQYDAAYSYHKWEDAAPTSLPPDIENFRVTHYETFGEKFNAKDMVMKQSIRLRYYHTETQREKSLRHEQEWKYYPESKRWFLISPPITFE